MEYGLEEGDKEMEGEKGRKKMMTNLMMKRTIITSLSLGDEGRGVRGVSKKR